MDSNGSPQSTNSLLTATVLNRLAYGPTPDELERVRGIGPDAYIARRQRKLQDEYATAFPDLLDLMVVCVDAGLSLEAALDRISREMVKKHRALGMNLLLMTLLRPAIIGRRALCHCRRESSRPISRLRHSSKRSIASARLSLAASVFETRVMRGRWRRKLGSMADKLAGLERG